MGQVTSDDLAKATEGQTIASAFLKTVAARGNEVALRGRDEEGQWNELTFDEYAAEVAAAAAGLRQLGVEPGDRVVMMIRNVPEFHPIDMAVTFCGATPISIYNSSSPEQISYLAGHCKAKVAVVENDVFAERFTKVRAELPDLKEVVNLATDADKLFLRDGPIDLQEGASLVTPDTIATVIYTSGTTGPPKGVVLTQRILMWTAESLRLAYGEGVELAGKKLVSYLPMAHIAERMVSHYSGAIVGYEVSSCPDPAQLALYLREVRPNILFGVPRVWEKLHAGVSVAVNADAEKAAKFNGALEMAKPIALARSWGESTPEQDATWDQLQAAAFGPLKTQVGLDEVEFALTGAAPIPRELIEWYNAVGVPLSEIYGMSECCGPMTWTPSRIKPGTVGPAIPGCELKVAEDGEVCCRGGHLFAGYLDDPAKTAEAIDDEGWLHSGDIGVLDEDGYLKIVDRKKELIITAGGKNISPANLEASLKTIPLVGQACAIGDNRPFVSALVVLDPEVAPGWAKSKGIEFTSLLDLAEKPEVIAEIESGVERVMAEFNNAERVKKVKVLGEEWLPDSEVLTPTSKLKRRGIFARYEAEIESLYSG